MVQAELHEKPSLIPVSGFRGRFSINGTDLYTMVNAIPGRNLPVLNSEPTGFAHANGKQPRFCIMRRVKSHECNQSPILRKQLNENTAVDGYNSTLIWVLSVSC